MVTTGQEMVREKKFLQGQEKFQGISVWGQGKFKCMKEIKGKWNFKSTYLFFSLYIYCFLIKLFEIFFYILRTWIRL